MIAFELFLVLLVGFASSALGMFFQELLLRVFAAGILSDVFIYELVVCVVVIFVIVIVFHFFFLYRVDSMVDFWFALLAALCLKFLLISISVRERLFLWR